MTPILLENQVAEPCQVVSANAKVDDRPLERTTISPPGAPAASLDRPILAPGEHEVSITAQLACSGADLQAVLQMTQPVYIGKSGASITIVLSRDTAAPSGLSARLSVVGGEVLAPRADGGEVDCRGRVPLDRAICRTESALAQARKMKDAVRALCVGEKLREMRLIAETLSRGPLGQGPAPNLDDVEADATRRVIALADEADRCVGDEMMGGEGTVVERGTDRALPAFR